MKIISRFMSTIRNQYCNFWCFFFFNALIFTILLGCGWLTKLSFLFEMKIQSHFSYKTNTFSYDDNVKSNIAEWKASCEVFLSNVLYRGYENSDVLTTITCHIHKAFAIINRRKVYGNNLLLTIRLWDSIMVCHN